MSPINREAMMKRLYICDTMVITGFILLMWAILVLVLSQVITLLDGSMVKTIAMTSALTVGIFCTASLVAVLVHLKQKRRALYGEDVENLLLLKGMGREEETVTDPGKAEVLLEGEA